MRTATAAGPARLQRRPSLSHFPPLVHSYSSDSAACCLPAALVVLRCLVPIGLDRLLPACCPGRALLAACLPASLVVLRYLVPIVLGRLLP
ncbi:hypothetical protein MTO96_046997 [Rhipicephalus appendiculatus]